MKYLIFFLFVPFSIVYGQCNQETIVQYYNNSEFSSGNRVSVTFGKGEELSNSYNYIDYDQESLYCIIYGNEKKYRVKLFTSYNSIYKTTCSSINSIFVNKYVKGKDQEGRVWKIFKSKSFGYESQNYTRSKRKYNKVTSSVNHSYIANALREKQRKIDRNRESVYNKIDAIKNRITLLDYKIEKLNKPHSLVFLRNEIVKENSYCIENTDFGSSKSSLATISCLNRLIPRLDILEMKTSNYRKDTSTKTFRVFHTVKKSQNNSSIVSVRNLNGKTEVEIEYISQYKNGWISMSPDAYLYDATHNRNLKLLAVLGTKFSPNKRYVPYDKKIRFILYFEQLPKETKKISLIECEKDDCFNFYGVILR